MLNSITLGQYLPGDSVLHRMDPRAKLICITISVAAVLFTSDVVALCLISMYVLLVAALSEIKTNVFWSSLKSIWLLVAISVIIQIFSTSGESLLAVGFITVTREGLINSGWLIWRLTMLLLWAAALTFTTTPLQLTSALEWLLSPLTKLKVPVQDVAMMINLSLRFIPTLFDEARLLLMAQRSRGAVFTRGNLAGRVKGLVPFVVPLLTNIFRRADELAIAMDIRCYQVGGTRSRMGKLQFTSVDYIAITLSFILLVVVIVLRVFTGWFFA